MFHSKHSKWKYLYMSFLLRHFIQNHIFNTFYLMKFTKHTHISIMHMIVVISFLGKIQYKFIKVRMEASSFELTHEFQINVLFQCKWCRTEIIYIYMLQNIKIPIIIHIRGSVKMYINIYFLTYYLMWLLAIVFLSF